MNNYSVRSIHEVAGYTKMCVWYNPENYDIWQHFGCGDSGYHNFYCIYIELLLVLISALILVMLVFLHSVHFICFDICTSVIEESALLSVLFVIKYVMLIDWIWNYCCLIHAFLLLPRKIFYISWCAIMFVSCLCGRIANQLITCLSVIVFHFSVDERVWSLFYL